MSIQVQTTCSTWVYAYYNQIQLNHTDWIVLNQPLFCVVFSLCSYYIYLNKSTTLHLKKPEFPSLKEVFCQVWLVWFWRGRFLEITKLLLSSLGTENDPLLIRDTFWRCLMNLAHWFWRCWKCETMTSNWQILIKTCSFEAMGQVS